MSGAGSRPAARRAGWLLGLAAVLAAAAWARLARFPAALPGGEAVALDGDSHYHVRRILGAVRGVLLERDPLVNWPFGASAPWSDGFDLLGAGFALLAGGGRPGPAAELAVFLWPVVLGVLVAWAAVEVARRLVPEDDGATPLAAGLLAAFVPHLVAVSSFGNVDHHVAEALSVLLLLSWVLRRFPVGAESAPGVAWEGAGAAAVALASWVFVGGPLYVLLAAVPLAAAAFAPGERRLAGSGAPALLGGALLAALSALPSLAAHGRPFTFAFPSLLQAALVAAAGIGVGALVLTRGLPSRGEASRRRALRLALAAAAAALPLLAVAPIRQAILLAVDGWLLRGDPWIAQIGEFRPLLRAAGGARIDLREAWVLLGPVGLAAPASLPLAAVQAARLSRARAATFTWTAAVFTALALLQLRFTRVAAPLLAVALALALRAAARPLAGRAPSLARAARLLPLAAAVLLVALVPGLRGALRVPPAREPSAVDEAALALRIDRPPERGRRDGVLVPWDHGHAVLQLSGRPVVANGFGTYLDPEGFREVEAAFRGDERRLVETMERRDLGFVVGGLQPLVAHQLTPGGEPPVAGDPPVLNPAWIRATPLSQLLVAGSGLPALGVPHLERLMPVFASRSTASGLSTPLPLAWAYALVPGARMEGAAAPGARVVGEIELVEWGRPHRYRAWTVAGPDGRWTLRVAVPSGFAVPSIRTGPAWRVAVGDASPVAVAVPERAVREGLSVPVP